MAMEAGDALCRSGGYPGDLNRNDAYEKLFCISCGNGKGVRAWRKSQRKLRQGWSVNKRGVEGVGRGAIRVSGARRAFSRDDAPSVPVLGRISSIRQAGAQHWKVNRWYILGLRI